jgi:hypothetical protein
LNTLDGTPYFHFNVSPVILLTMSEERCHSSECYYIKCPGADISNFSKPLIIFLLILFICLNPFSISLSKNQLKLSTAANNAVGGKQPI